MHHNIFDDKRIRLAIGRHNLPILCRNKYRIILFIMYCLILLSIISTDVIVFKDYRDKDYCDFITIDLNQNYSNDEAVVSAVNEFINSSDGENIVFIHDSVFTDSLGNTAPVYIVNMQYEDDFYCLDNVSSNITLTNDFDGGIFWEELNEIPNCVELDEQGCFVVVDNHRIDLNYNTSTSYFYSEDFDAGLVLYIPRVKLDDEFKSFSHIVLKVLHEMSNSEKKELLDRINCECKIKTYHSISEVSTDYRERKILFLIICFSAFVMLLMTVFISNQILLNISKHERIRYIYGRRKFGIWLDCVFNLDRIMLLSTLFVGVAAKIIMSLTDITETLSFDYWDVLRCLLVFCVLVQLIDFFVSLYFYLKLFRRPLTCLQE